MPVTATAITAPPVRAFSKLLLQLHALDLQGRDDDADADALREQMSALWPDLNEQERSRVKELSGDLQDIAEGGVKSVCITPAERKSWGSEFKHAYTTGDWDALLALLRHPPADVPASMVPFQQARCWEAMGDLEVALAFMREAERIDPGQAVCVLTYLILLNRKDDLPRKAEQIIADQKADPDSLYLAASALSATVRDKPIQETKRTWQRIVGALQRALGANRANPRSYPQRPSTESVIICLLGLCYQQLGRSTDARMVYDDGIERNPDDSDLLTFRGLLLYEIDKQATLKDFERSVWLTNSSVWPYYLLAHELLQKADFERCQSVCLRALAKTERPDVLAQLHEWIGICRSALSYPAKTITDSFDNAEQLDPTSDRIKRNRQFAESILSDAPKERPPWLLGPEQHPTRQLEFPPYQEYRLGEKSSAFVKEVAGELVAG
jgi:tetratricopeptide (TPR) repeat protein